MCLFPKKVKVYRNGKALCINANCGKCIECLRLRTNDWAFRLCAELQCSEYGVFITLTYDDEHVPESGVQVRDLQLFFKKLRKAKLEFSYYAIGEYGTTTFRPHYHACLFIKNEYGFFELHKLLEKKWNNGFIKCVPISQGRIRYCIGYLIGQHTPFGKNKNFTIMSKRPALGQNLLLSSDFLTQIVENDFDFTYLNGFKVHLPRYYRKKVSLPEESFNAGIYVKSLCSAHLNTLCKAVKFVENFGGNLQDFYFKYGDTYDKFKARDSIEKFNYDKRQKMKNKKLRND